MNKIGPPRRYLTEQPNFVDWEAGDILLKYEKPVEITVKSLYTIYSQ